MNKSNSRGFSLKVGSDGEVAYLKLPTHPGGQPRVAKSMRILDYIGNYEGPDVVFDFDENGILIGLEILA